MLYSSVCWVPSLLHLCTHSIPSQLSTLSAAPLCPQHTFILCTLSDALCTHSIPSQLGTLFAAPLCPQHTFTTRYPVCCTSVRTAYLHNSEPCTLKPWSSDWKVMLNSSLRCSGNQYGISSDPKEFFRNELWYTSSTSNLARKISAIGDCSANISSSGTSSSTENLRTVANQVHRPWCVPT